MKRLLFILLCSTLLLGLGVHALHTEYNDEIPADMRSAAKDTSLLLIKSIRLGDEKAFKSLCSDELLKQFPNVWGAALSVKMQFQAENYELFDEYYNVQSSVGSADTFTIVPLKEKKLIVTATGLPKYSFMQFWRSDSLGFQHLLFVYYGKKGNEWKLKEFHLGDYSIENKIPPELLKEAKRLFEEKRLLPAVVYAFAAQRVMRPAPYLQYQKEKEYIERIEKIGKAFQDTYHLPISLAGNGGVNFFDVDFRVTTSGIVPVIKYVTTTSVTDEKGILSEAARLYPKIDSIFHGVQGSFNYVILQAYNELPKAGKASRGYNSVFKDGRQVSFK